MDQGTLRATLREKQLWGAIFLSLCVRYAFHRIYGLSFDDDVIWWQMLDVEWLRREPLQSLYLMHMQPPLLNALFALALQLPFEMERLFLQGTFLLATIAMLAILYFFLRRFGYRPLAAGALAGIFGLLPEVLLYENIFFYAHLEAAVLLAAMLFAALYLERGSLGTFVGLAVSVAALALMRSLFHLGWVAVVLLSVWMLARRSPAHRGARGAMAVAFVAVALVASVYVKNFFQVGLFAASSWEGPSIAAVLTPGLPGDEQKFPQIYSDVRLRAMRGEFSRSLVAALNAKDGVWMGWMDIAQDCDTNVEKRPVLCAIMRSNGEPNMNHVAMVRYSRELSGDAGKLLRLYPGLYLHHIGASLITFLGTPAWDYRKMAQVLPDYTGLWDRLILYRPGAALHDKRSGTGTWSAVQNRLRSSSLPLMLFVVAGYALALFYGTVGAYRYWRGRARTADWFMPLLALLLFATVPHMLNGVESQRMRYSVEPMLYLSVACGVRALLCRAGLARPSTPGPGRA